MTATFQSVIQDIWPHDPQVTSEHQRHTDMQAMALLTNIITGDLPDPTSYKKATDPSHPEKPQWEAAVLKETNTLEERKTWRYVKRKDIPKTMRPIRCKFVFKKKFVKDGTIQYKARLVACGITQRPGLDYSSDELYASVCSYSSMRFLMSLATQKGYQLYQTDIQGAYLESDIDDEIYMDVPPNLPRFDADGDPIVCKIERGLYGLKQSGYAWSQCFKEFMMHDPKYQMGFTTMSGEPNLYRKTYTLNGKPAEIFVGQYVDDCLLAASSKEVLQDCITSMSARFPVNESSSGYITTTNPGLLLSMHVRYDIDRGILQFDQRRAIEALAKKYHQDSDTIRKTLPLSPSDDLPKLLLPEKPEYVTEFLSMIGSCLHICQVSRPDCSYAVGVLSRHAATPGEQHMAAARQLIAYMHHTRQWCIQYTRTPTPGNLPGIHEYGSRLVEDTPKPHSLTDTSRRSLNSQVNGSTRTSEESVVKGLTPNTP